jgi:hypothetical protein
MVARVGGYAYDVGVWDLSIVQGPFFCRAVPNLTISRLFASAITSTRTRTHRAAHSDLPPQALKSRFATCCVGVCHTWRVASARPMLSGLNAFSNSRACRMSAISDWHRRGSGSMCFAPGVCRMREMSSLYLQGAGGSEAAGEEGPWGGSPCIF